MVAAAIADIPHVDVDPFSLDFFADPFPTHERLRERSSCMRGPRSGSLSRAGPRTELYPRRARRPQIAVRSTASDFCDSI